MGMYTASILIVGRRKEDLADWLESQREIPGNEEMEDYEFLDDLDRASPYFDSCHDDYVYGVIVMCSADHATEVTGDIQSMINLAHAEFAEKFGMPGVLYLSPHVT